MLDTDGWVETTTALLDDDDVGPNISTAGGKVVVDLGSLLQQVGEQVGLPEGVLDAIPAEAGQFEIVDSDRRATARG